MRDVSTSQGRCRHARHSGQFLTYMRTYVCSRGVPRKNMLQRKCIQTFASTSVIRAQLGSQIESRCWIQVAVNDYIMVDRLRFRPCTESEAQRGSRMRRQ